MLAKTTKYGTGCAVDHFKPCILGWVLGDRSSKTFEPLWKVVEKWQCYFYVTQRVRARVEGENTRLRHCALERTASEAVESTYVDCSITSQDPLLL